METTVKERLIKFLKFSRVKQFEFCDSIGVSHGYVCSIRQSLAPDKLSKIREVYPELNIEWLLTGKGEMLNSTPTISMTNTGNIQGNGNNVNVVGYNPVVGSSSVGDGDVVEELPVIPSNIVNEPKVDVLKYITMNDTDTAPVVHQFPEALAYYKIKSKAMEDKICAGDVLAITPYPKGEEFIIPGDPYVVDTNTNGLITRRLFCHPDGYRAVSNNPEDYPEFVIPFSHVIRVYRIVGLLRQNVI